MSWDMISLRGMLFFAYHGARPEERTLGQRFAVDLDVHLDLRPAGQSDNVRDTVNYSELHTIAREVVMGDPRNLLESLGERIASQVLAEFSTVARVRVRIAKPSVAIAGSILAEAAVTVDRSRG